MIMDFLAFLVEIFIQMHTMSFQLLGELGWTYHHMGLVWAIMDLFLAILSIVLVFLLDFLIIYGVYCLISRISIILRTKETKYYNVTGKVIKKIYHPPYTSYQTISTGKSSICTPQHHSEEYIVRVQYRDMTEDFYSESLYNTCKVKDSINLVLIHKLDRNNKIIEATLELPE